MKRKYTPPYIHVVAQYSSCLMSDTYSGNIIENETEEINVFLDGETVKPEEALGKQHHCVWDDWGDRED